ncbi:30S ribosomal protein S14 [Rubrivirga sp. SAORIC476]|uniref:30S ribosomal protein S14 n=1 Tax=Rubrivirga sp. SAORIC476 TaxID=1961794 RepID=UPI000BA99E47|nr:30S ribosomal protein S14 [Rubrivirga sp. SAORIC476]MBC12676.1 30S ribosomal protein S14 [Rhodothermaceae bacterium]PAP74930.1 30S ribosomal protein S14 [Rubrivirga sp. SAORIC476]|tara:strand:+ start:77 stop:394 length:318 start_codon:yes stop_codon:yes gene_type:complete
MAKTSVVAREKKRRKTVQKYAAKRAELKEQMRQLKTSEDFNPADAQAIAEQLQKLPRNASPVRLHNRCALTGRPRGYIRTFGVCRNVFRELAVEGKIPGVRKSSW